MRRLKLYIATSLDGYIAGPYGEIDWLQAGGNADYDHQDFYASIDGTLMGHTTYKLTLTVDNFPCPDKTNYVFTRGPLPQNTPHVQFVSGDIAAFVRQLKDQGSRDIWLVGGGQINTVMLNENLIDDVILTILPLVLGQGIPLFAPGGARSPFNTVACERYETGLIQWHLIK